MSSRCYKDGFIACSNKDAFTHVLFNQALIHTMIIENQFYETLLDKNVVGCYDKICYC